MACAADVLWAALAAGGTRPAVRDAAIELSAAQLLQDMRARRARLDALEIARAAQFVDGVGIEAFDPLQGLLILHRFQPQVRISVGGGGRGGRFSLSMHGEHQGQ